MLPAPRDRPSSVAFDPTTDEPLRPWLGAVIRKLVHTRKRSEARRVARVVIGMVDPDRRISGQGIQMLRTGRIDVGFVPDDLAAEVEELNRHFKRAVLEQARLLSSTATRAMRRSARSLDAGRVGARHEPDLNGGLALYTSEPEPFTRLRDALSVVERSLLMRVQIARVEHHWMAGRLAIAEGLVDEARRRIGRLRNERAARRARQIRSGRQSSRAVGHALPAR